MTVPFPLWAADPPPPSYECNLSGGDTSLAYGCVSTPGPGTSTSTTAAKGTSFVTLYDKNGNPYQAIDCAASPNMCAVLSNTGNAIKPVDAWGRCRYIDNNDANPGPNSTIFVPFQSFSEWASFISSPPPLVTLKTCAVPYSVNGAPATVAPVTPPFTGCSQMTANAPDVYGRPDLSTWYTVTSGFTCHVGATTMMSRTEFIGRNVEDPMRLPNDLSWDKTGIKYSPDMTLTPSPAIIPDSGMTVTLSWSITPFSAAEVTCQTLVNGVAASWPGGPNAAGYPRIGVANIPNVSASTTFGLSCSETPALSPATPLTSVASAGVSAIDSNCYYFGWCGGYGDGGGGDGGGPTD
jgi:hypothetical protein